MTTKTALIFGASGHTGRQLLDLLLAHHQIDKVVSFGRKAFLIGHPKLVQINTDFETLDQHMAKIKGDILFCCLGTTIKKAGSKEAFRKVDFEYPEALVRISEINGIQSFVVISSIGANAGSGNFYLRTKGEMEKALVSSAIPNKIIVRPSLIMGKRNEKRLGEGMAIAVMKAIGWLFVGPLKKYRGISPEAIAKAMLYLGLNATGNQTIESYDLKGFAEKLTLKD